MRTGPKAIISKIPAREWRGLVPVWEGGRLRVDMKCHICKETNHWKAARMVGPQTAIPKIIQMGWHADGKVTCPACLSTKRNKDTLMVDMKIVPPAINSDQLVEADKKNKRLVILALEDDFSESESRYRAGKSDKSVAAELGLAESFVAKVRKEFYGDLCEPPEIAGLRAKIAQLEADVRSAKTTLDSLCQRNGWKV